MRELARLIRLVAPRSTTVLIEGETGTGKEVVAQALHRLSRACGQAVCGAELRGDSGGVAGGGVVWAYAWSVYGGGAVADGTDRGGAWGTLFLDEIGEMPLALQAKMLRFLECGELQRVGDNETVRVDVRVIAATHQPLEQRAAGEDVSAGSLSSAGGVSDWRCRRCGSGWRILGLLAEHFLEQMGRRCRGRRLTRGGGGEAADAQLAGKCERADACAGAGGDSGGRPAGDWSGGDTVSASDGECGVRQREQRGAAKVAV